MEGPMQKYIPTKALPFFKEQTWRKLRSTGGGPPYYKISGRVYYDEAEVSQWIICNRHASTAEDMGRQGEA
jgi:hypothetical protein